MEIVFVIKKPRWSLIDEGPPLGQGPPTEGWRILTVFDVLFSRKVFG